MTIKIESLPSRNIINFHLPWSLCQEKKVVVINKDHCSDEGFVKRILAINNVQRCLFTENLVSVLYAENAETVRLSVLAELADFSDSCLSADIVTPTAISEMEVLDAVADAFIRPTLIRDQGDLEIVSWQNGILTVKFMGHCAGCPYAQNTLKNVVMKTFQRYMSQIEAVRME